MKILKLKKHILLTSLLLVLFAGVVFVWLNKDSSSSAADARRFNASNIMSDFEMTNKNSMSEAQIQSFLVSKNPCNDRNISKASNYPNLQYNIKDGKFVCLAEESFDGESAARIIWQAAQDYSINPQVLIVLLEKEQGLVTDTWPNNIQYRSATGYGCPDNADCNGKYFGFKNQVRNAANFFRAYQTGNTAWYKLVWPGDKYTGAWQPFSYNLQYHPNLSCGTVPTLIENRATASLYSYTPYRPNQAALNAQTGTGDSCSSYGNRNFWIYFSDWFGFESDPVAFKSAESPTIYIRLNEYKLTVPYMAAMQDYGISIESIKTVDQQYINSIPNPPENSGISSSIGHVVKSPSDTDEDGGSIYLISLNKRYQFKTMQQFFDFGFKESDIRYLPMQTITSKQSMGSLPTFFKDPTGTVFENDNAKKRIIFDYKTYISRNPSDNIAEFSYFLSEKIPSGTPATSSPILFKRKGSDVVYLLDGESYYTISTLSTLQCWGINKTVNIPLYNLSDNSYIENFVSKENLSCAIQTPSGENRILNGSNQIKYESIEGVNPVKISSSLEKVLAQMPIRTNGLSDYIKSTKQSAVWQVSSGGKRLIPTYQTLSILGISDSSIETIPDSIIRQIANRQILLASGQNVKYPDSAAIYGIANDKKYVYAYAPLFEAYGNDWSQISSLERPLLDTAYPTSEKYVSDVYIDSSSNKAYLMASNGCFLINQQFLSALTINLDTLSNQYKSDYKPSNKINLSQCKSSTIFIKGYSESLVYLVRNGKKAPIRSFSSLLQANNGTEPVVMSLSSTYIDSLPLE